MFPEGTLEHWTHGSAIGAGSGEVLVVIDPTLTENRSVSILRVEGGPVVLSLSPERGDSLSMMDRSRITGGELAVRLDRSGVRLHDPDLLFLLPVSARAELERGPCPVGTRRLTEDDRPAFARLVAQAPEKDVDEAFVELDHWLVVGTSVDGDLASAASAYPWRGTRLADLGVITLPAFRGRGFGRTTVRAICAETIRRGHEPQYRCRSDNSASVALARAAGFHLLGRWQGIDTEA